jgi:flagellar basal body rod protein FlgB
MPRPDRPWSPRTSQTPTRRDTAHATSPISPKHVRQMQTRDAGRAVRLSFRTKDAGTPASPNGNSVSLELEMLRGIEAQRAHSRAMRVYGSALGILRASIGRN